MEKDLYNPIIVDALLDMDSKFTRRLTHPTADKFRELIPFFQESLIKDGEWNLDYYLRLKFKSKQNPLNPLHLSDISEMPPEIIDEWKAEFTRRRSFGYLWAFAFVADGEELSGKKQRELGLRLVPINYVSEKYVKYINQ